MATWIAHMRIAEHFMHRNESLNNIDFLVGNIGPDCGMPNEDWSKFTPDKSVSHWMTDGQSINAEDFKQQYVTRGGEENSFYMGYYFHLLTDIEWRKLFQRKKLEPLYYEGLNKDSNYIWTIKKDWYGQDHLYLQNHPDSVFFTMFSKIKEFPNRFIDFYPEDAFIRQINHITQFYLTAEEDANRDFPYLTKDEMDDFVNNTIRRLL